MTPTARTLQALRKLGYLAAVVESWVPRINVRRDLFGLADVLAIHPRDKLVLLVQATSDANVSARLRKIMGLPVAAELLRAGLTVEVWGWSQRRGRWQVRRVPVVLDQVEVVAVRPPRRRAARERGLFG